MSAFDIRLNIVDFDVAVSQPEEGDPSAEVTLVNGHVVPIMGPEGPQGAVIPLGALRFQVPDLETAKRWHEAFGELVEILPDRSALKDFTIASNMSQAQQAAEALKNATGR